MGLTKLPYKDNQMRKPTPFPLSARGRDRRSCSQSRTFLSHHRYSIKVSVAQCITIQVRTSKPDAFIKLQVLESEETMVSTQGKGQAIIPAFYFLGSERALSSQCKYLPSVWLPA